MQALAIPILTARATRINAAHRNAVASGLSMLAHAVEAGAELAKVKRELPHGSFQSWIAANCEFSERTARNYIRVSKTADPCRFDFEGGLHAALESMATPREPSPLPQFTHDDAERILKLAAMANGGNVNEEIVACEMLDKMASRFGMTGEEAQAKAGKLRPEMVPELVAAKEQKERDFIVTYDEAFAAAQAEVQKHHINSTREELLEVLTTILCNQILDELRKRK